MKLKFRAWDKHDKKMYKIDVLNLWEDKVEMLEKRVDEVRGFKAVDIMQSTGMLDKDGIEVFEGDIIKPVGFASWIGSVEYSPETATFVLKDHNNDFLRSEPVFLSQFTDGLKILGNVYENPELLKENDKER